MPHLYVIFQWIYFLRQNGSLVKNFENGQKTRQ